jgi:hypothetical protein
MKQNPPTNPPKPDIPGDLIVNKPTAPAIFVRSKKEKKKNFKCSFNSFGISYFN